MSIFAKLLSVNAIIAVTWIFGLINNIAITGVFGLNRSVDAYFASFMLINLFIILVVDFLGKNFLPIYAIRREVSAESASELTSLVITKVGLLSVVVTGLLVLAARPLFTVLLPGFKANGIELVLATFSVMAPCIVIKTVNTFHEYVWQHNEQFNRVVISRTFVPITLTVFILGFGGLMGTMALPYGFLTGHLISAAFLLYRIPYRYRFRFGFTDRDLIRIMRNSAVLMSTGFIARSRSVFVQYFGSQLGEGAIAALSIAQKICKPIHESALVGIRMILFSRSAKALARSDIPTFARMHKLALRGVFFVTVPIALWYAIEGELLVRVVFQRGAFTDEMVMWVYAAMIGYAASIVFSGALQMVSNAFYALDKVKVPAVIMPLGTVLFVLVASILAPMYGLLGLASTTSIIAVVVCLVMLWQLKRAVQPLEVGDILMGLVKYAIAGAIAVIAAQALALAVGPNELLRFVISGVTLGLIYVALVWVSRDKLLLALYDRSGIDQLLGRWRRSGGDSA
jgi:putative peptidoglycan lipid II flippase